MNKYIFIIFLIFTFFFIKNNYQLFNYQKFNYNVVFCGTVRNVEKYLQNALNNIELCSKKFNDYAVIIYENDSSDNTRNILLNNKKNNYHYILDDNITESRRTVRLANGRNKILDKLSEINSNNYFQYLIILDMDDMNDSGNFVNTIDSCFKYDTNSWDVLTGNQHDKYFDIWALRKKYDSEYDCWRLYNKFKRYENDLPMLQKYVFSNYRNYPPNQLLEVDSAFGCIAIYKISAIGNCRYNGEYPDGSEKCEHVDFNSCIKKSGGKIFINTSFYTDL